MYHHRRTPNRDTHYEDGFESTAESSHSLDKPSSLSPRWGLRLLLIAIVATAGSLVIFRSKPASTTVKTYAVSPATSPGETTAQRNEFKRSRWMPPGKSTHQGTLTRKGSSARIGLLYSDLRQALTSQNRSPLVDLPTGEQADLIDLKNLMTRTGGLDRFLIITIETLDQNKIIKLLTQSSQRYLGRVEVSKIEGRWRLIRVLDVAR